jgi:dihydroorotate dehydrogenase electron transfer subunit
MEAEAVVAELCLIGGLQSAYVACNQEAIPAPGRYVLAHEVGSEAPLATELFAAEYRQGGFVVAPPVAKEWKPGSVLDIRGPLGNGFNVPRNARRVALIAFNDDASRLLPLAERAGRQGAAVALVCKDPPGDLPLHLEVHPPRGLPEVFAWADYTAIDVQVGSVPALKKALLQSDRLGRGRSAQALVRASMPCGGLAECGVCTVRTAKGPRWACVDGPVFELGLLVGER